MKLLKGTAPQIKVSGSYSLLRPMGNTRGTKAYTGHDKVYALYDFSTDISSAGNLPDSGPNGFELQPSGGVSYRPDAPIKLGPFYGGTRISDFALGFPTHEADFDTAGAGNSLISITVDNSNFSFTDGVKDTPFSISAWYSPDNLTDNGFIVSKYDSTHSHKEYVFAQSGVYEGAVYLEIYDDLTGGMLQKYSAANVLEAHAPRHVVVTYDGSATLDGIVIYVNGKRTDGPVVTSGNYLSQRVTPAPFVIGNQANAHTSKALDGDLAQVCVWQKALSAAEVATLYEARLGVTKFGSGVVSNPSRVQLIEKDIEGGQRPINLRTGDPDYQKIRLNPFDDTNTVTFLSSFSKGEVRFCGNVKDGDFIDLTGSLGVIKKRFKFLDSVESLNYDSAHDTPIFIKKFVEGSEMISLDKPKQAALIFAEALNSAEGRQLNIRPEIDTVVLEKIDAEGNTFDYVNAHERVVLHHKLGSTGSFEQGNVISTGRASVLDNSVLKLKQFSTPRTEKINFSTKASSESKNAISSLIAFPNISPDIEASGSIMKGVSDDVRIETLSAPISPFKENRLELRNNNPDDYKGLPHKILRGFNSALRSKTAIVLEFNSKNQEGDSIYFSTGSGAIGPLGTYDASIANMSGSGMAYWSHSERKWQHLDVGPIIDSNFHNEISDPFSRDAQKRAESCLGFSLAASSSLVSDVHYVNASGGKDGKAAHNLNVSRVGRGFGIPVDTYSFPWGIQYNATGSQEILMSDYIEAPFLIQKMRVYVDGVFGVGTSSVNLRSFYPLIKNLFILNQTSNGDNPHTKKTELVKSRVSGGAGSIGDEQKDVLRVGSREIISWAKLGFVRDDSFLLNNLQDDGVKNAYLVAKDDFDNLYQYESNASVAHITASFSFDLDPKNILSSDFVSTHGKRRADTEIGQKSTVPVVVSNTLGGAGLLGEASGRQIGSSLGNAQKELTGSFSSFPDTTGVPRLFPKTSHYNISPYLVHPTDRLVFGWQNIQMRNNVADSTLDEQAEADQFVDKLKNVKIVLYGSHVRGGVEYIPSMNQNLSTNQIYETILGEPVLDKFDVESIYNLSGSTSDALFFGTMKVEAGANSSTRGRRASIAKGQAGTTGSLARNIAYIHKGTNYKDSLAPPISHVISDVKFFPTPSSLKTDVTIDSDPYSALKVEVKPTAPSSKIWKKVGVFGEKDFTKKVVSDVPSKPVEIPGGGPVTAAKVLVFDLDPDPASSDLKLYGGSAEHIKGVKSYGSPEIGKPPAADPFPLKGGDKFETGLLSSIFWAGASSSTGKSVFPVKPLGGHKIIPAIKVWKYGFWSGVPHSPKHHFSRSQFGQFRNLMEQPPETFTVGLRGTQPASSATPPGLITGWPDNGGPVKIRFYARNGTADIDPLDTNTQNLSAFATSSMPYYDGQSVERDVVNFPPPDLTDKTSIEEAVSAIIDGEA